MSVYEADLSSADVRILELPTGSGFADFSISAPRDGGYAITFAESPDGTETQSPGIPTLTAGGRIEGVQTCEVDDFDLLNKVTITLQGEVWRFDGTAEPALSRLDDLPLPGLVIADGDAGRRLEGDGLNDRIDGGGGGDDVLIGFGGKDVLTGGAGADVFVLTGLGGTDPEATNTDWGTGADRLAIDDQLLGPGDAEVDIRALTGAEFRDLRDSGTVLCNPRTGKMRIDIDGDGDGDGDGDRELVAVLGGGTPPDLDAVMIFRAPSPRKGTAAGSGRCGDAFRFSKLPQERRHLAMPTSYALPATSGFLTDDGSIETSAYFQQSSIALIYDDAIPVLDYRVPDPDLRTSLLVPSTAGIVINNASVPALNAEGLDVEIEISRLSWDGGSTVVLRTFQIPVDPDDYRYFYPAYVHIAELGGDPLPLLAIGETDVFPIQSDVLDFFNDNADGYATIPEGQPFGPGQGIPLATLPDVEIRVQPTEGPDEITGGSGVDVIDGLGGDDTLNGGPDRDELSGGPGNDLLRGGAEDDILRGGEGDDVIRGQGGRDMMEGGPGADTLIGGRGPDTYRVDRLDTIIEDPGDFVEYDYVSYFGVDGYFDYGDSEDLYDRVWADESFSLDDPGFEIVQATGTGPIRLDGTPGNEGMIGNEENNILVGRGGLDGMIGRGGADTFVLTDQFGTAPFAYVADFRQSEGDRIAVDDQLLGLGRARIDVRDLTLQDFREIKESGVAGYDARTGELQIDTDGDGTRDVVARIAVEDLFDTGPVLTLDDFLLF